ncbi:MAG: hypothetical protein DMG09_13395 [Acidobacteria bacterium]|nr:MAG: hypothetical protein DMG09_13395 [Acidobacteriota bacterium]
MSRDPVDLTGVEDGVNAIEETITARIMSVVAEFLVLPGPSIGELPKFNLCQGATPFSRAAMMLSVTSWRRSRFTGALADLIVGPST